VNVSYTLDAFGGTRRQVEALLAQAEYQQFALEASYLTLTANIVTGAINEASLRAQILATLDIARSQQMQLDITQRRVAAGAASRADVLQQQATLQGTLATLPPLRSQLAQQRNQLAAYMGALPADYTGAEFTLDSLTIPPDLPVSLPSKFVEQRPDVREYSALLHQATAQVGVATANMLPQIVLTASYGQDASTWANLFSPGSNVWSLIGSLTQPIFKGGQLLHQRRAAVAAAQEAAANYKVTVITAFENVSNTLYALQADADALAAQTTAERAAADTLSLVQTQYKSGAASFLQVLSAEQTYQTAAVALIKARAQRYADTAALFQALGGGWWNRNDALADISAAAPSQHGQ
jgi:NodT family efflux transporter outer membrane factor (OMF) lipoprotein